MREPSLISCNLPIPYQPPEIYPLNKSLATPSKHSKTTLGGMQGLPTSTYPRSRVPMKTIQDTTQYPTQTHYLPSTKSTKHTFLEGTVGKPSSSHDLPQGSRTAWHLSVHPPLSACRRQSLIPQHCLAFLNIFHRIPRLNSHCTYYSDVDFKCVIIDLHENKSYVKSHWIYKLSLG